MIIIILCINETWLTSAIYDNEILHYLSERYMHHLVVHHGGVLIAIKNIPYVLLPLSTDLELLCIQIISITIYVIHVLPINVHHAEYVATINLYLHYIYIATVLCIVLFYYQSEKLICLVTSIFQTSTDIICMVNITGPYRAKL